MRWLILLFSMAASSTWASAFTVERNVVYGMYSGLALLADVYLPEEPKGIGIVFISGSGWTRSLSFDHVPLKETGQEKLYAVPLAEAGYTVFAINHRAAPRFRHPDSLNDVQRAVRFMRFHADDYGIDPNRIGAMGGSSGGHLVTLLATLDDESDGGSLVDDQSGRVQAVVARAAPTDLTLFEGRSIALFGFPSGREGSHERRAFEDASPVNHVSPDDPPMLLLHGDRDELVAFKHAEVMFAALEAHGVEAELLRIPGAGHGPHFPGAVDPPDYVGAMIDWFDRHLR
jgi:acetyl esterase/lipase